MEYMFVIARDETIPTPGPTDPGFEAWRGAWRDYTLMLMDGGHWLAGASLHPSHTATTVRTPPGAAPTIVDGPFVDTKEQLGGFYVIEAADLDEALALAQQAPMGAGSVEVRPVALRPTVSGVWP